VLFLLVLWSTLASFEDSFITFTFALLLIRTFRWRGNLCSPGQLKLATQGVQ